MIVTRLFGYPEGDCRFRIETIGEIISDGEDQAVNASVERRVRGKEIGAAPIRVGFGRSDFDSAKEQVHADAHGWAALRSV